MPSKPVDFRPVTAEDKPEVYASLLRVARRLCLPELTNIGLLPAARNVAVPPLALQLAFAMVELGTAPVNVFDANTWLPGLPGNGAEGAAGPFHTREIGACVSVTTSAGAAERRVDPKLIREQIETNAGRHARVLVDLTGFELFGDHLASFELVDGIVVVARAGVTTEAQLVACVKELGERRPLGVVLLG